MARGLLRNKRFRKYDSEVDFEAASYYGDTIRPRWCVTKAVVGKRTKKVALRLACLLAMVGRFDLADMNASSRIKCDGCRVASEDLKRRCGYSFLELLFLLLVNKLDWRGGCV